MWRLFHLMPLVLCLLLLDRANIGRSVRNAAIATGLMVLSTALLFFAVTFLLATDNPHHPYYDEPPAPAFFSVLARLLSLASITILPVVVGTAIFFRKRNPRRAQLLLSISVCFLLYASLFLEAFHLGGGSHVDSLLSYSANNWCWWLGERSFLRALFQLIALVLCPLLVGGATMGRDARNAAIAVGLLVVGTALLFFALTFLPDPLFRHDPFPGDFMRRSPAFDYFSVLAGLLALAPITILPVVGGAAIFFRKRNPGQAQLLLSISVCFLLYASLFLEAFNLGAGTYLVSRARAEGYAHIYWWWERHSATCSLPPWQPHVCDACDLPP